MLVDLKTPKAFLGFCWQLSLCGESRQVINRTSAIDDGHKFLSAAGYCVYWQLALQVRTFLSSESLQLFASQPLPLHDPFCGCLMLPRKKGNLCWQGIRWGHEGGLSSSAELYRCGFDRWWTQWRSSELDGCSWEEVSTLASLTTCPVPTITLFYLLLTQFC